MMSKIAKKKVPRNFLMMYQSIFFKDIRTFLNLSNLS